MTMTMTRQDATFPLLRETGLRKLLTEQQLQELERLCRPASRRPGTTLFRQGDPADTFYVLLEGMVELRARPPGRRVYRTVERSEEHTSELQSQSNLVCRLLL